MNWVVAGCHLLSQLVAATKYDKHASKSRPSGQWSDEDYDVFDGDRHIGRIMWPHAAPEDRRSTPAESIRSNFCCFALHCLSLDGIRLGADRCPYSKSRASLPRPESGRLL